MPAWEVVTGHPDNAKEDEWEPDPIGLTEWAPIVCQQDCGPVGIGTLSMVVSENAETLEEVYEPFLIQSGFIVRTPRGRCATKLAYAHLGRTKSGDPDTLFD